MDRVWDSIDWEALPPDVADWMGMPDQRTATCRDCGATGRSTEKGLSHRCAPVAESDFGGVPVSV